jgi:NAD(P)-dependent dehydrogenase (short-subunit alcohol dehydrogenase family)
VKQEHEIEALVRSTLERFGRIDILVHCAGILRGKEGVPKFLVQTSTEEMNDVIDTNLKGTFLCNRAVLPAMIKDVRSDRQAVRFRLLRVKIRCYRFVRIPGRGVKTVRDQGAGRPARCRRYPLMGPERSGQGPGTFPAAGTRCGFDSVYAYVAGGYNYYKSGRLAVCRQEEKDPAARKWRGRDRGAMRL